MCIFRRKDLRLFTLRVLIYSIKYQCICSYACPHTLSLLKEVFSITVFLKNIIITTCSIFWLITSPACAAHLQIAERTNFSTEPEVHIYKVGGSPVNFFSFLLRFRMFRFLGEKKRTCHRRISSWVPALNGFLFCFLRVKFLLMLVGYFMQQLTLRGGGISQFFFYKAWNKLYCL